MSDTTSFVPTEISLDVTVEDSQMTAEPTVLGVHSDLQGYQTPSSDALKQSLNTQSAAAMCDDEDISEGCQDRSTTVSTKKLLPSEDQQLLATAVKVPEKEQMVAAAFQNEVEDKTLFPEQTNDSLQQPVHIQSSVEFPQLASFKKQVFCEGLQNVEATLHPEVVVHFRRGRPPGDVAEPHPFVEDGGTQTDNREPTKQSVEPTIDQQKSLKENLPAVVKVNRPPISTAESVSGSTSARLDCRSFSTPAAVAFKKNRTGKTTLKPQEEKNSDLLQDCALPGGPEDETQSTTFKLNSKSSKDAGEGLLPTSKDQFPARIAASAVAKVPEEVCSAHVFFLIFLVILSFTLVS